MGMDDDLPGGTFVDMELGETEYHKRGGWTHFNRFELANGESYKFLFDGQEDGSVSIRLFPGIAFYGIHDTDLQKAHLQYVPNNGCYEICWDTPIYSLEDAKQIAAEWSKRTNRRIKTGKPFES